ncbi:transmembrane channel-like protein 7 isoform X4 [Pecten maximus]|uniref:transmembrane channel-like protein 7 isoform X4 n=1 Tax=Pecten maximus TaxID=6579 RepID=UPI001457F25E|nr:transmembrane channel-like protein 7 isoform X4 [Pecten maximus]
MISSTGHPRSPAKNGEIRSGTSDAGRVTHKSEANQIFSLLPSKLALTSDVGITMSRKHEASNRKTRSKNAVYPEENGNDDLDEDLKELSKRGIRVKNFDDEEDVYDTLKLIKNLPCSLQQKRKFRAKLTERPMKRPGGCSGWIYRRKLDWKKFKIGYREFKYQLELWGTSLKKIEGQQGAGVLSYFVFLRTLFKLNIAIFFLMFIFVTLPASVNFSSNGYTSAVTGTGIGGVDVATAQTCSANYEVNVSSDAATVIVDFLQGTGWMEATALFLGWYDANEYSLGTAGSHNFNYIMPLAVFLVVVVIFIISLAVMAQASVKSFKETIARSGDVMRYTYNIKVFCSWDYAVTEELWSNIKQKSVYKDIVAELSESKFRKNRENMTSNQKCALYTKRFLINWLILAMLGGSAYLIYYVQKFSTETTSDDTFVLLLIQYLPSITLGALNGLLPIIFELLIKFEDYTTQFAMKLHLIRIVFLKLASLAVLIISIYSLITCGTRTTPCNVGIPDTCSAITCWETYVGQTFYKLVVTDFLIHVVVILGVEGPRMLLTTKCDSKLLKKIGPAVFDIPKSVLALVYSQMLNWIGLLYCPMITSMTVISFFVVFYLKYLSAMKTTGPPEKPYRASRNNSFFIAILLLAFFLSVFPVGYTMVSVRPSTGCGPFRIYSTSMSNIIDASISNLPTGLNNFVGLVTSTSAVVTVLVFLIIIIYFCSARGSAYNGVVKMLEEQLTMESRDKQFLMARVYELTGEKPAARKKDTVSNVNEKKTKSKKTEAEVEPAPGPSPHSLYTDGPVVSDDPVPVMPEEKDPFNAPPVYRSPSPNDSRPVTPKIVVNNTDWDDTPRINTGTTPATQPTKPLEF